MRARALLRPLIWCLLAGLQPLAASAAALWQLAPRPPWVAELPPGTAQPLHDRQIHISDAGDERYEHTVLTLTELTSGADSVQLSEVLDPRYQQLQFHSLRLSGANASRVFSAGQIRALLHTRPMQSEPQRAQLDPRVQLSLQLPDARAGDVLDCEYTVQSLTGGFAGLIPGHYAAQWPSAEAQPLHWMRLRVLWPAARPLQYRVIPGVGAATPQVRSGSGELELQWRDLAPATEEADTPRWFAPRGLVQLSDFTSWSEVAARLRTRYEVPGPGTPMPAGSAATPAMILEALHLVQSKVRVLNGSAQVPYQPAEPAALLQRGFGDGHDVARLLVSLLRRLGLDAHIALADTHRGAVLDSDLPNPYVLDAALVQVRSGGLEFWINPAAAPGGELPTTDSGDLRHALLIGSEGGKMILLPPPAPQSRMRSVWQQFDLRAGNTRPATLNVTTRFLGTWAQAVRADLLTQSQAQLQLTQMHNVTQDYPDASPAGEVARAEEPQDQSFKLLANFRLPRPFGSSADPHFDFFAETLAAAVMPRDEPRRLMPLSVPWPLELEEHIDALLPPEFTAVEGSTTIATPAFRYQREVRVTPGRVLITHRYVTLSDHVDAADYPGYLAANAQVYKLLGVQVRAQQSAWRRRLDRLGDYLLQIVIAAGVLVMLAIALWRRRQHS